MTSNLPVVIIDKLPAIVQENAHKLYLPERIIELNERFENARNIADVADRLMALDALRGDLEVYHRDLWAERSRRKDDTKVAWTVGGVLTAVVIVGLGIGVGPFAALGGLVWGAGFGGVLGLMAQQTANNIFDDCSPDCAFKRDLLGRISGVVADIEKNVDPRLIVKSSLAENVFQTFPNLKEKFLLAQGIDRMREDMAAQTRLPALEKQQPAAKPEL